MGLLIPFLRAAFREVEGNGKGAHGSHGKECWHSQIVCHRWHHPCQMDECCSQYKTEVIVVDISTGKPWVIGGEVGRMRDRGEVRQVHWLFTPHARVPQVGVVKADEKQKGEEAPEQHFLKQQELPARSQEGKQLCPFLLCDRPDRSNAYNCYDGQNRPPGEWSETDTCQHPCSPCDS